MEVEGRVKAYFEILSWRLLGGTDEIHGKHGIADLRASQYERGMLPTRPRC
jgi:hypothetical protein